MLFSATRFTGIDKPHANKIKKSVSASFWMFPCSKSYSVTPAVDDGLVLEVTQPCHYQKTGPVGIMQWPRSLLTSRQIHFVIHYIKFLFLELAIVHCSGYTSPMYNFKSPYFKHLWAKNIFSHSSGVKIICLESFSQMSISIFVLCWTRSNKSTMGFIHKNAQSWFSLSKMWDLYAFML